MSKEKGKIVKGIGGFYYVETAGAVYECKARGNFRNQKLIPLVGDNVEISVNENSENRIESIFRVKQPCASAACQFRYAFYCFFNSRPCDKYF